MSGVLLGPIRLIADHRAPGAGGGPTLRVLREPDGRELLRFDCLVQGAHWHLDPSGRDVITQKSGSSFDSGSYSRIDGSA